MKRVLAYILRLMAKLAVRFIYRVRVVGAENLPTTGPALLVSNHVSFADVLILGTVLERPVRFLMGRIYYDAWGVGHFAKLFDAVPVDTSHSASGLRRSLETMIATLKAGGAVALFPEGAITRTSHIRSFKRGFELIARGSGAPIIPIHLDGLWGSIFSYKRGRFFWKRPERLPYPVTVSVGRPLASSASRAEVRQAIMELGAAAFSLRKRHLKPLHARFWRNARLRWFARCMSDSTGRELTWGRTLAGSLALARRMRAKYPDERMVGMMLPASVGAALVNIGALIAGKTPVNLNFLGARDSIDVAVRLCNLRVIFTTRPLLQKASIPERPEFVYIEDMLAGLSPMERFTSYALAAVTPAWLAERVLMARGGMDDPATVMFTSGSSGKPKGVLLSHHNVVSNIQAFSEVVQFGHDDTMVCVLPLFHSFGFTAALWAALTCGMRIAFHPNPLDAKGVGQLVMKYRGTVFLGTPTFYALYARAIEPAQFHTLRIAVAGGQRLPPAVAQAFEQKFGLPLREGYGCTELSPVVAVNVPDVPHHDEVQYGTRRGSVGIPLPGLALRMVDSETMVPVAPDAAGLLLIKGPSVMQGYVGDPEATAAALRDGWYVTGDIASVDAEGFLHIHDRVSRFSKIGGEMVSHGAIEEKLEHLYAGGEHKFCVVSLADPTKGETISLLYSGPELSASELLKGLSDAGLPNLWLPGARDIHRVEAIPLLPTGKTDLGAARKLAADLSAARSPKPA